MSFELLPGKAEEKWLENISPVDWGLLLWNQYFQGREEGLKSFLSLHSLLLLSRVRKTPLDFFVVLIRTSEGKKKPNTSTLVVASFLGPASIWFPSFTEQNSFTSHFHPTGPPQDRPHSRPANYWGGVGVQLEHLESSWNRKSSHYLATQSTEVLFSFPRKKILDHLFLFFPLFPLITQNWL